MLHGFTKRPHMLQINEFLKKDEAMSIDEVAMGFIRVANETMCRPIRALTQVPLNRAYLLIDIHF